MNEPIEFAQKSTGIVTVKQLLAAIKAGNDSHFIHGEATYGRESYSDSFIFTISSVHKSRYCENERQVETITKIDVPAYVSNGNDSTIEGCASTEGRPYKRYCKAYRPTTGSWWLGYKIESIVDILEVLPAKAEVAFHLYLDAGTHDYLINSKMELGYDTYAGLHADHLYLYVTYPIRGVKKTRKFLIDTQVVPHNSARFGFPRTERQE